METEQNGAIVRHQAAALCGVSVAGNGLSTTACWRENRRELARESKAGGLSRKRQKKLVAALICRSRASNRNADAAKRWREMSACHRRRQRLVIENGVIVAGEEKWPAQTFCRPRRNQKLEVAFNSISGVVWRQKGRKMGKNLTRRGAWARA